MLIFVDWQTNNYYEKLYLKFSSYVDEIYIPSSKSLII